MKIGIVNDLPLAVTALQRAVAQDPSLQVIWVAANWAEAVARCAEDLPDLVLMDLMMPVMNGVEATRRIMASTPCAIVVVTSDVLHHTSAVFEAMGHGALDAVDTPRLGAEVGAAAPLLRKIKNIGWLLRDRVRAEPAAAVTPTATSAPTPLLALGASAGGPATLAQLLSALPADFPAGIVMVQHVDATFAPGMAAWLDEQSALTVRLAQPGDSPRPGVALLAGTNDHLALDERGRLYYTPEPLAFLYRPSIDVFFDSVVQHWTQQAAAVLLTGMGRDGAQGLKRMRERGHYTIAQDEHTSAVYGMPKAAAALGAARDILPIDAIAPALVRYFR